MRQPSARESLYADLLYVGAKLVGSPRTLSPGSTCQAFQ